MPHIALILAFTLEMVEDKVVEVKNQLKVLINGFLFCGSFMLRLYLQYYLLRFLVLGLQWHSTHCTFSILFGGFGWLLKTLIPFDL